MADERTAASSRAGKKPTNAAGRGQPASLPGERREIVLRGGRAPVESLAQRAARSIGTAIVRGAYKPGDTLPVESEICYSLGVGRNILREAVKILAGKGLIRTVRRAGTIVMPRAAWSLLDADLLVWSLAEDDLKAPLEADFVALRGAVAPAAAAAAAVRPSAGLVANLSVLVDEIEAAGSDRARSYAAEIRFIELLLAGCGNRAFAGLATPLAVALAGAVPGRKRAAPAWRAVVTAVAARNSEAAAAAMGELVESARPSRPKG